MNFESLVEIYEHLEKTASGNKLREILSEFLKKVPKNDIAMVAYLTLGNITSDYESKVLGMAEKMVLKAIAVASGQELSKIKKSMNELGDAGLVAEKFLQNKPRTLVPVGKLTVHELFEKLHKIAEFSGTGSQDKKTNLLVSLLQKSSGKGAKYITRITLGTLRMGVAEMTVIDSVAIAFTGDKKNKTFLEKAYNICPDVGVIAKIVSESGLAGLEKIEIKVGRPIKMMLAQRVTELQDVHKKIPGTLAVEGKYDGERIQVHKSKEISLFSRRLENITAQFPDLIEHLEQGIKAKEFIAELEVLAIDSQGNHLPFQVLMQRRRKNDIEQYIKKIPVQGKLFDLLYLNGKNLLHEPYEKRMAALTEIVKESKHIKLTDRIITDDVKKMDKFFKKMLKEKYEGIMIKNLQGEYQAGTRGWNWIKWKKDYSAELSDTFDLVVLGAYHGKGRRSGTFGALLCAAYDDKNDLFKTVCKLGTGLSDEMLAKLPEIFSIIKKKPPRVDVPKEMIPDVWVAPDKVVEVLGAELTISSVHTAGYALRFPRFLKFRNDKKSEQATTVEEIGDMA